MSTAIQRHQATSTVPMPDVTAVLDTRWCPRTAESRVGMSGATRWVALPRRHPPGMARSHRQCRWKRCRELCALSFPKKSHNS
jgi:hypothetical protein